MVGTFISRRTRRSALRSVVAFLLTAQAGLALAVGPNNAANDTGVTTFGDFSSSNLTSEPAGFPGQDARLGRDAAAAAGRLTKVGAGSKGFDFTKIANDGAVLTTNAVLGTGATDWACTYDNVTGLMWEVKINDAMHLRHNAWTYTWYDSNSATNGGSVGTASGGNCKTVGRCDTEKFVQDVNTAGMCGHSDWRMPTKKELISIVDYGRREPAIDPSWFPNTSGVLTPLLPPSYSWSFWAASASAANANAAWSVSFSISEATDHNKSTGNLVRLVRVGQ